MKQIKFGLLYLCILIFFFPLSNFSQNTTTELIPYRKGEKWGFADKTKKIKIPCEYDKVSPFYNNPVTIVQKNNKYYLLDKTGKIVPGTEYGHIAPPSEELYVVCKEGIDRDGFPNGKQGYINAQGKIVIPLIYDAISPFSDGLAMVRKDGTIGFIDKTGKVIIPFQKYFTGGNFKEGMAWVKKADGTTFLIDKTGKEYPLPPVDDVDGIYDFSEGLAIIRKDEKYGAVDKTGKVVIPTTYFYLSDFIEGLAVAKKSYQESGFVDKTGKLVIPYEYSFAGEFKGGLAYVKLPNNKEGFIDKTNKMVITIPEGYVVESTMGDFIILMDKNKQFSVLDKKGNFVFKNLPYLYVENFKGGIALVESQPGLEGYIDLSGTEYWEK